MRAVRVQNPQEFDQKLNEQLKNDAQHVFVLFFGTEDPSTNESWCPDCVIADPAIRRAVSKIPDSVLLECPADRQTWKFGSEPHPYKAREDIKLERLPTLMRWGKEGVISRLVEEDCAKPELLEKFVNEAL
ncbi:hypothetical protein K7432_007635 [Basidiobolus ranarum]|uniref:Thioredoxin domain-containing protein n=1 Tax=Basidiobolus ranarum TaxID=34480 RepID=A0ABR2WT44_9FUNG